MRHRIGNNLMKYTIYTSSIAHDNVLDTLIAYGAQILHINRYTYGKKLMVPHYDVDVDEDCIFELKERFNQEILIFEYNNRAFECLLFSQNCKNW
jgi:hypothetical protein